MTVCFRREPITGPTTISYHQLRDHPTAGLPMAQWPRRQTAVAFANRPSPKAPSHVTIIQERYSPTSPPCPPHPEPLMPADTAQPVSAIVSQALQWLWPRWVARGVLTLLDGDPGLGKSTLAVELAARVSRGPPPPPPPPPPGRGGGAPSP